MAWAFEPFIGWNPLWQTSEVSADTVECEQTIGSMADVETPSWNGFWDGICLWQIVWIKCERTAEFPFTGAREREPCNACGNFTN